MTSCAVLLKLIIVIDWKGRLDLGGSEKKESKSMVMGTAEGAWVVLDNAFSGNTVLFSIILHQTF